MSTAPKTISTATTRIGKFYHLFAPWNTTWHYFYYPIDPERRAKMAGIVNKVYSESNLVPCTLFPGFGGGKSALGTRLFWEYRPKSFVSGRAWGQPRPTHFSRVKPWGRGWRGVTSSQPLPFSKGKSLWTLFSLLPSNLDSRLSRTSHKMPRSPRLAGS